MKVDLHTHSILSPDGGLSYDDYNNSPLDQIAITDHDEIDFAKRLYDKLCSKIIIGQEITSSNGEMIGLFLHKKIKPGLSPRLTAEEIKKQGGIVYIPHPFETIRNGISESVLDNIKEYVDIIEVVNGRAYFQNCSSIAYKWAMKNRVVIAASSDAHGLVGWGNTYTEVSGDKEKKLDSGSITYRLGDAKLSTRRVGIGIVYPKLNRLRKKLGYNPK